MAANSGTETDVAMERPDLKSSNCADHGDHLARYYFATEFIRGRLGLDVLYRQLWGRSDVQPGRNAGSRR